MKTFEIDDDYCKEATDAYFAEEEEMKLGIHPTVDDLITENDEARIGIDLWFSEHEIDKDFYIEETTPESNLVKVYIDDDDEYGEFSKFFGIFDTDKCDFIDDQMSISENMKFFGIEDNPFDIMMHAALKLTRSVMFSARRYRNKGVIEALWESDEDLINSYAEMIRHQYSILNSVNEETVKFLRDHSYMGSLTYGEEFNDINKYILAIEHDLDTIYSHIIPCRDLEYEKVRLESDPATMMRLLSRQNLADKYGLTKTRLYHLLDVLECPEGIITTTSEEEESVKQDKKFIEENRLTSDDIEYMISYVEKKERK